MCFPAKFRNLLGHRMLHTLALGCQAAAHVVVHRSADRILTLWEPPSLGEFGLLFPRTPLAVLVHVTVPALRGAGAKVSTRHPFCRRTRAAVAPGCPDTLCGSRAWCTASPKRRGGRLSHPPFPESPPVIEPCLVVPLPGLEPGKSPQSECGAFANLTRGA